MTFKTQNNLRVCSIKNENVKEYWLQSHNESGISDLCDFLSAHCARPVSVRLFGNAAQTARAADMINSSLPAATCPPLILLQDDLEDSAKVAIQAHAIAGMDSQPLYCRDEFVGIKFTDYFADYLMLRALPDAGLPNEYEQAVNLFAKIQQILQNFGSDFTDTIRTWLYADDILAWYGDLNRARNEFFEQHDIYHKLVPASTGIGAKNPQGLAIAAQALAVIPKNNRIIIQPANSPLQCPALDYKSSFSRAVKLSTPKQQRLYVSGTASINPAGQTVNIGNTPAQIRLTMDVVQAILRDAGMDWHNTVSSLAYFKHPRDFHLFDTYCREHRLNLPHIKLHSDICRDDLLFELELDAVKTP